MRDLEILAFVASSSHFLRIAAFHIVQPHQSCLVPLFNKNKFHIIGHVWVFTCTFQVSEL